MSIEFNLPYSNPEELHYVSKLFSNNGLVYASPIMGTPYLEPSQHSSPFADQLGELSPYAVYQSFSNNTLNHYEPNDIYITNYLGARSNIQLNEELPVKNFNGDQNLLIIDKSKLPVPIGIATDSSPISPKLTLQNMTEKDSNSLFPPLGSSQENDIEFYPENQDPSLDTLLDYTDSPLSQAMEDYEQEEEIQQEEDEEETKLVNEEIVPKKIEQEECKELQVKQEVSSTKRKRKETATISNKKASNVKLYKCHICGLESKRKYNLSTHIRTHNKKRVKEFNCVQCDKSFDRRHDRDRHLATVHRQERSFGCDHCVAHFSRRDGLNRHLIQKHEYTETDFEE